MTSALCYMVVLKQNGFLNQKGPKSIIFQKKKCPLICIETLLIPPPILQGECQSQTLTKVCWWEGEEHPPLFQGSALNCSSNASSMSSKAY